MYFYMGLNIESHIIFNGFENDLIYGYKKLIIEKTGNLFDHVLQSSNYDNNSFHFIVHGCNAQGAMGTGFAKELRERYPTAYKEYAKYHKTFGLSLGDYVSVLVQYNLMIINAVTQQYYGYDGKKYVNYDAIGKVFESLNQLIPEVCKITNASNIYVHFPSIGAGLAGGDWSIISSLIDEKLNDERVTKIHYVL